MFILKLLSLIISSIGVYKIISFSSPDEIAFGSIIFTFGLVILLVSLALKESFGKLVFLNPPVLKDSYHTVNYDFVKLKEHGNKSTFVRIKKFTPFVYFKSGSEFIDYDGNFIQ